MPSYSEFQEPTRLSGSIIKWIPEKGFGFIQGQDGHEYFFHRSAVRQGLATLQGGQAVTFVSATSPKGPRAEDVELA